MRRLSVDIEHNEEEYDERLRETGYGHFVMMNDRVTSVDPATGAPGYKFYPAWNQFQAPTWGLSRGDMHDTVIEAPEP